MSIQDRNAKVQGVIESLERDMELLCLTGVEDKLQEGVRPTLEMLKNAGIKVSTVQGQYTYTNIEGELVLVYDMVGYLTGRKSLFYG